ncbi:unknown protein [Paenibacillus amylolyticus]|uniref:HEAT repeat domain-containing protein n=1 Tax=Paenibacillus amylolyticus TaxID=1451 RepID=A0A100VQ42_PAEAM|nr:unknown protein [Paenibacillus amylolyticus]
MDTLIAACSEGKTDEQVIEVCRQLAATETVDEWNAGNERDLPERQRLLALIDKVTSLSLPERRMLVPLYAGIITCLKSDETMKLAVVRLHLAMTDWSKADLAIDGLEPVIDMVNRQPYVLDFVKRKVSRIVNASKGYWKREDLLQMVDQLNTRPHMAAFGVGLCLLKIAGEGLLWNEDCTDRLRVYRNHEQEAVRLMALDIWTTLE